MALAENLLAEAGKVFKSRLLASRELPFELTVLTNVNQSSAALKAVRKKAMQTSLNNIALSLAWPLGIYSLSHVALPFPPDDPIYGELPFQGSDYVRLGKFEVRGEKGVFAIPKKDLMRLRNNPFYSDMEERIRMFVESPQDE
jgi:hypothetical protein